MKRVALPFLVAFALASAVGFAASSTAVYSTEAQHATRNAPTNDGGADTPAATAKIKLAGVQKIRATVCACTTSACAAVATNQTLDGGYLDIWYEHPVLDRWVPNPDLSLNIGQPTANACRTWADVPSPGGNLQGAAMGALRGVGVNAGDGGNFFRVVLEGIGQ